jgi:Arc/MetJ family transcription regulator
MGTNLQIDDNLIIEATKLGGHKTKKAAVTTALQEYVRNLKQEKILSLFGKIDFDPNYDYKRQRRRS